MVTVTLCHCHIAVIRGICFPGVMKVTKAGVFTANPQKEKETLQESIHSNHQK